MAAQQYMIQRIAQVCHEANCAIQYISGDANPSEHWLTASDSQRQSAMDGVRAYLEGDKTPAEMHAAWSEHKLREGWTYGREKDEVAKTHPCLVPYDELPEDQRLKDRVFINVIKAFQEHAEAEGLFGL